MSAAPALRTERAYNPFTWRRRTRRNFKVGMLFISPWLVGFLVFTLYPMLASLVYSFSDFTFHQPLLWVGFKNYNALFHDRFFWKALVNTGYMVIIGVPAILAFSFLCAVLLNIKVRGQALYRVIYYIPSIVPVIASTLLWIWVLNPQTGLLNTFLGSLGIDGPNWLKDPNWSKPALLLLSLWGTGNTMIIFLSALQDVPQHLLEAAELDGASWWQKLRHITLPMVSPVTLYNLIILVIGMFKYFEQAYVFARIERGQLYRREHGRRAAQLDPFLQRVPLPEWLSVPQNGLRLRHGLDSVSGDPGLHHLAVAGLGAIYVLLGVRP